MKIELGRSSFYPEDSIYLTIDGKTVIMDCATDSARNKRSALRRIYCWSMVLIRKTTAVTIRRVTASPNPPYYSLTRLLQGGGLTGLTGRTAAALGGFAQLIQTLRAACQGQPLMDQALMVIRDSGLKDHHGKDVDGKGEGRVENLDELVNAASLFVNEEEDLDDLTAFLSHAALEAGDAQGEAGADCVQLMTLHSAKGLEFRQVFLVGVEEGLFPSQRSIDEPSETGRRTAPVLRRHHQGQKTSLPYFLPATNFIWKYPLE